MDALEFLTERRRMCNLYAGCFDCPLADIKCIIRDITSDEDCEKIIDTVEKWSKENPRKTRQDVLLEQWPNAEICDDNILSACPKVFDRNFACHFEDDIHYTCYDCRRKFWSQKVE